jgi:hypothetical protein
MAISPDYFFTCSAKPAAFSLADYSTVFWQWIAI